MKIGFVILLFASLLILIISVFIFTDNIIHNNQSINTSLNSNNSSNIDSISPTLITNYNNSLAIPPNDYVINSINWSLNPNLKTGYVYLAQVCEPNDIVPHKFIAVQILTEVKGTNDKTIIKEQLGNVAVEARRLYGPNSAICILGTDHGVVAWTVTMRVYDDKIYY